MARRVRAPHPNERRPDTFHGNVQHAGGHRDVVLFLVMTRLFGGRFAPLQFHL